MECIVYPQKLDKLEKDLGKTLECSHISPSVLKNRKLFILGTPKVGHDRRESHVNISMSYIMIRMKGNLCQDGITKVKDIPSLKIFSRIEQINTLQ